MMGMARRGLWAIPFLDLVAGYPGAFILCTSLSCTLMIDASSCIYLIFNRKSFLKGQCRVRGYIMEISHSPLSWIRKKPNNYPSIKRMSIFFYLELLVMASLMNL